MNDERTYTIDGTTYKDSELSIRCKNVIVARAEIQQSKLRHELELEKIEVLTNSVSYTHLTLPTILLV